MELEQAPFLDSGRPFKGPHRLFQLGLGRIGGVHCESETVRSGIGNKVSRLQQAVSGTVGSRNGAQLWNPCHVVPLLLGCCWQVPGLVAPV